MRFGIIGPVRPGMELAERATGRDVASGVPISTAGTFEYEINEKLRGPNKWETYEEMESDAHVKGALRDSIIPLTNAKHEVLPAGDSPRDKEIAELVSVNLLGTHSDRFGAEYRMSTPYYGQRLNEALDCLHMGFSLFSVVTKVVEGRRVYAKATWLEPTSLAWPTPWVFGVGDEILAVRRQYRNPNGTAVNSETLPARQLRLLVWDMKGARMEGRALIRSLYGPWFRKDFLLRMGLIWAQKVGAPAPWGYYPDDWSPEAREDFTKFLKSLRGTAPAHAFGVFPRGKGEDPPAIQFAGADGEVDRMPKLIEMENLEMSHGAGTKSSSLGEGGSASRALGQTIMSKEMIMVNGVGRIYADQFTNGVGGLPGWIKQLVDWNYSGVRNYPALNITKIWPAVDAKSVYDAVEAARIGLLPVVPETRRQVTERLSFVLPDSAYELDTSERAKSVDVRDQNDRGTPGRSTPKSGRTDGT